MGSIQIDTSYDKDELSILMSIPTGSNPRDVIAQVNIVLEKYIKNVKSCPNCKGVGSISEMFGWRNCSGTIRPQSWCSQCRSYKK